jgi:hypothetical protein
LNAIDAKVFPLPVFEAGEVVIKIKDVDGYIFADPGMTVDIVPSIRVSNACPVIVKDCDQITTLESITSLTAITLGTGAAIPLKYRNGTTERIETHYSLFNDDHTTHYDARISL